MLKTHSDIRKAIQNGKSARSIVEDYLKRIEEHKDLNAFLEVFTDSALAKADEVDRKIKEGKAGKLAGLVLGIKDNICFKDHKVSASSKILEGFTSLYTATALQRLLDEDAIVIGRLNCDEFAMGSSNENSAFGPVKNAVDPNKVPGGSSGGSATAVRANLCTVALGSDTGGSIRQPASFTGTYGFKPTYGRISRYGLIAYASSFDQIGPFANDLNDIIACYEVMGGYDEMDPTSSSTPMNNGDAGAKKKVGVIKEYINHPGISEAVKSKTVETIEALKANGHEIVEFSFPYLEHMVPTYYVLTTAEASSNLSRFDGVHYGYQSPKAAGVEETYKKSRSEGFGMEVKRRIMAGTFVLSHGYYDAYYTKGQKVRRVLQDRTDKMFEEVDVLLTPTTPNAAFDLGGVSDPIEMYLQDIFTVHANLTGNPAISLPLGTNQDGLPFGLQLIGKRFDENTLFAYSKTLLES